MEVGEFVVYVGGYLKEIHLHTFEVVRVKGIVKCNCRFDHVDIGRKFKNKTKMVCWNCGVLIADGSDVAYCNSSFFKRLEQIPEVVGAISVLREEFKGKIKIGI